MSRSVTKTFSVTTKQLSAMNEIAEVFEISTSEVFRQVLIMGMIHYVGAINAGRISMAEVAKKWIEYQKVLGKRYEKDIAWIAELRRELKETKESYEEDIRKENELLSILRQKRKLKQQHN